MPDTLLAAAFVAFALLMALHTRFTPPGLLPRFVAGRRYHRDGKARHAAPRALPAAPAEPPALATIHDPAPFMRAA